MENEPMTRAELWAFWKLTLKYWAATLLCGAALFGLLRWAGC